MANLLLPLLTTVASQVKNNFIQKTRQTDAVQEQFLRKLLFEYQNTELGRTYKIGEIKTIDQFRSRIPVLPYRVTSHCAIALPKENKIFLLLTR